MFKKSEPSSLTSATNIALKHFKAMYDEMYEAGLETSDIMNAEFLASLPIVMTKTDSDESKVLQIWNHKFHPVISECGQSDDQKLLAEFNEFVKNKATINAAIKNRLDRVYEKNPNAKLGYIKGKEQREITNGLKSATEMWKSKYNFKKYTTSTSLFEECLEKLNKSDRKDKNELIATLKLNHEVEDKLQKTTIINDKIKIIRDIMWTEIKTLDSVPTKPKTETKKPTENPAEKPVPVFSMSNKYKNCY